MRGTRRPGIVLVVFLLLFHFLPRLASAEQPAGRPSVSEQKPVPPLTAGSVIIHAPICAVAATMGAIVLIGSLGTTWRSYQALLEQECITPLKRTGATQPSTVTDQTMAASDRIGEAASAVTQPKGQGRDRLIGIGRAGPSFLVIDATPAHAQVFLDGRLLGSAQELVARAFPVQPGRHTVEILASGFRPYRVQLNVDPTFSSRLHVSLRPQ